MGGGLLGLINMEIQSNLKKIEESIDDINRSDFGSKMDMQDIKKIYIYYML